MTAAVQPAALALAVCALLVAALAAGARAFADSDRRPSSTPLRERGGLPTERILAAILVGLVLVAITRLLAVGIGAGVLVACWHRLLHDDRAADERRRIEGIATWLEDLRDTLRGSSMGVEEALEQVAQRPPEALRAPLSTYLFRRRQGFRTEDALTDLADDLAHPTSDAAVAALRLVVTGSTGAARLHPTVSALAAAARDEVRARERVDRTRAVYISSMQRLVVIAAILIAYLRFAGGSLLDPYRTPAGQLFLMVPLAMWAGCILWLRSLCRYEVPDRYRIVGADRHMAVVP
jgi:tight adherence protein B